MAVPIVRLPTVNEFHDTHQRIDPAEIRRCGAMMSLRITEPEKPGFDARTFECPKCYGTETFVASISPKLIASIVPA